MDFKERFDRLEQNQIKIREDIAALKVKSSVWGMLGGTIPVIVVLLGYLIGK